MEQLHSQLELKPPKLKLKRIPGKMVDLLLIISNMITIWQQGFLLLDLHLRVWRNVHFLQLREELQVFRQIQGLDRLIQFM